MMRKAFQKKEFDMSYDKQINELKLMLELADNNNDSRDIALICRNVLEKAINQNL